ncbi:hypothetical protein [Silicimonas sp. MF1-12-2]|uniref:hypothetical protein n=1 Tax=Silicimonas sp. MF1-12-2 TaxID=3384793 RepID=UPI0039B5BEA7
MLTYLVTKDEGLRSTVALGLVLMPLAAFADESGQLVPRDQCEPLYSVQKRGCVAEHVLRCQTPDGLIYRSEMIEDGELTDVEFADADFEFVSSWNAEGMRFLLELTDNRDPFSLTNLLTDGVDQVDQTALVDLQMVAPREAEFTGSAAMTGNVQSIEGGDIESIAVVGALDLGTMVWEISGEMYLDLATQTLFTGPSKLEIDGFAEEIPGEPVRILRAGDQGFMLNITMFDCGEES